MCDSPGVNAHVSRVSEQILVRECILVLKKHVVHRPEVPRMLRRGRLGGLCRARRMRMVLRESEMPEDEPKIVPHVSQDSRNDGVRHSAIRAFEVAILQEGERSVLEPPYVVVLMHRVIQRRGHGRASALFTAAFTLVGRRAALSCVSAATMPSAPGFTSMGERQLQLISPLRSTTKSARSLKPSAGRYAL
jgi:hypothetical protein